MKTNHEGVLCLLWGSFCNTGNCVTLMGTLRYLYSQNVKPNMKVLRACCGNSLCSTGNYVYLMGKLG